MVSLRPIDGYRLGVIDLLFVSALSIVVLLIDEISEEELEPCPFPMDEKLRSSNMSTEVA